MTETLVIIEEIESIVIAEESGASEIIEITTEVSEIVEAAAQGLRGVPGEGVPAGGATGQILAKASGTDFDTEWLDNSAGGAVDSVNGQTGAVALDADDISDASTTNKFVTAAEKTKLSNLSGTNSGDQDLSAYATKTGAETFTNKTLNSPVINSPSGLTKADVGLTNADNTSDADKPVSTAQQTALDQKQDELVSGTKIKTVNGASILGSGDLSVPFFGQASLDFGRGPLNEKTFNVPDALVTANSKLLILSANLPTEENFGEQVNFYFECKDGSFDLTVEAAQPNRLLQGIFKINYLAG